MPTMMATSLPRRRAKAIEDLYAPRLAAASLHEVIFEVLTVGTLSRRRHPRLTKTFESVWFARRSRTDIGSMDHRSASDLNAA